MTLKKKPFENVGKGKYAGNLTLTKTDFHFSVTFNLSSTYVLNFNQSKFCHLVELTCNHTIPTFNDPDRESS